MVGIGSLAVLSLVASAPGQSASDSMFGLKMGLFYPSSAALRDALGGQWFSIGLTRVRTGARAGTKIVTDLELIRHKDGGNKVAMFTPSVSVYKDFAQPGDKTFPFVSVGAGLSYFDYTLTTAGVRSSTKRLGPSLIMQAGYIVDGRFIFTLRYNWMPNYDGYGFSGLSISAGYSFFRLPF